MKNLGFKQLLAVVSLVISVSTWAKTEYTTMKSTLTLEGAKKIMAAAEASVVQRKAPGGAIAITDDGGHIILIERIDGTFAAAALISYEKARTAAEFRKDTNVFEEAINKGRTALAANRYLMPLQGGVPIKIDGQIVGAVGVSGTASQKQDEEVAMDAAKAIQSNK